MHVTFSRRHLWIVKSSLYLCHVLAWLLNRIGFVTVEVITNDTPVKGPYVDDALWRTLADAASRAGD